jgi:anaerobic magnesium-protoporphyrin IX monomethyl ester cyclase
LGYIASYLESNGFDVEILDCTFKGIEKVVSHVNSIKPSIIGVYSMFTMKEDALNMGKKLRDSCDLLVVGGPLPTVDPISFLNVFDVSVIGEGEETMLEILKAGAKSDLQPINGLVYKRTHRKLPIEKQPRIDIVYTSPRSFIRDLDSIPFPTRGLFENQEYQSYYRNNGIPTTTSIVTSRGCPYSCDLCSKPLFGNSLRLRSPENVVDEVKEIKSLGYERVSFQDDCFNLMPVWVRYFSDEVIKRKIEFEWECFSRVDKLTFDTAKRMREAGCKRVYYGPWSGNDKIMNILNKRINVEQAASSVNAATEAGLETGAFFTLGYPGETNETILETIKFALKIPLNYLSFSLPHPIPGTALYEEIQNKQRNDRGESNHNGSIDNELIQYPEFSERKLKFAITKAITQFYAKKRLGNMASIFNKPFEIITDRIFRMMS